MMRRGFFSFSVLSSLVGGAHGFAAFLSPKVCPALARLSAAFSSPLVRRSVLPATAALAPFSRSVLPAPPVPRSPWAQTFLRPFSSSRDTSFGYPVPPGGEGNLNTRDPAKLFHADTRGALEGRFERVFDSQPSTKGTEEPARTRIRALVHASLLTGGVGPDEVLGLAPEDLLPDAGELYRVVPFTAFYRGLVSSFRGDGASAALSEFLSSLLNSASYVLDRERQSEADRAVDLFSMVQSERIVVSRQFVRGMLANAVLGNLKLDPVSERKYMYGGLDLVPLLGAASCPVAFAKTQCLVEYFQATQQESAGPPRGAVSTTEEPQEPTSVSQNSAVEFRHVTLSEESFDRMVGLSSSSASQQETPLEKRRRTRDFSSLRPMFDGGDDSRGVQSRLSSPPRRSSSGIPAQPDEEPLVLVVVHGRPMELPHAHAFVDFANENFGVGRILPGSATQEEILQFTCPEFNLGMLHYGVIDDNSAVVVHGVRRFSSYEGYGEGFRFTGGIQQGAAQAPSSPASFPPQSILVLDAVRENHFAPASVKRDVKKFFLGLKATLEHHLATSGGGDRETLIVSTGKWGCGIFRGNVVHKFVQQYVAAKMVEEYFRSTTGELGAARFVQLHFSSYDDTSRTGDALSRVATALDASGLSGAEIYERVLSTSNETLDSARFGRAVQDVECLLEHIRRVSVPV